MQSKSNIFNQYSQCRFKELLFAIFFKETSYCFIDLLKRAPIPIKVIGMDSFQLTKSHFSFNKFIREHLFPTSNALFYPLVGFHVAFRKKKIVTTTFALLLASSTVENTTQNIQ